MKKTVPFQKTYFAIIFAVLVIGALGIYYISNSPAFKKLSGAQAENAAPQISVASPNASPVAENEATSQAVDCSNKVAQDKKLLAAGQKSDCLFIGCGDFFQ